MRAILPECCGDACAATLSASSEAKVTRARVMPHSSSRVASRWREMWFSALLAAHARHGALTT